MTERSFPATSSANGGVTSMLLADLAQARVATGGMRNGVLAGELNNLEVYADSTGMQVKRKSGRATLNGSYYSDDAEKTLAIANADLTNPRIDLVVLTRDALTGVVITEVVTGTPAASPAAPTLTSHQMEIGRVAVGAGVSTIAAGNATMTERVFAVPDIRGTPVAKLYRATNQSINSGSLTAIQFSQALIDNLNQWSAGNTTRLVCRISGEYRVSGRARFAGNAVGRRILRIWHSASGDMAEAMLPLTGGADECGLGTTELVTMTAGQYLELRVEQSSGGALNVLASSPYAPVLSWELVRAA